MNQKNKLLNRIIKLVFLSSILVLASPFWLRSGKDGEFKVEAHPGWARKYNAKCTLCHTTYPRLNRTGYEFKRLGYRLPKEVETKDKGKTPELQRAGSGKADHQTYVIEPTGYKPEAATSLSEQGQALFGKLNCAGCHTLNNAGGHLGPPLDGVGGRRNKDFLTAHLTDPAEHAKKFPELHGNRPNRMPHPHATPNEVKSLVAYLLTLPEPPAGFRITPHAHGEVAEAAAMKADFSPAPVTDASRAGQKLYFEMGCAACHTINKVGGQFGPKLDGIGARRSREFIAAHITNPRVHTETFPGEHEAKAMMPPTGATAEQIEQIAAFLMTLPMQDEDFVPPKNRIQDYFAVSYLPGIEIEKEGGETKTTYEKRELIIYAAGPIGRNFSFFVQPLPLSEEDGFMGKFEMMQGLFNHGGASNFMQVRFGQLFNLRNAGFGPTDRGLTESLPFIFQPSNGFNPAGLGRGASFEYTLGGTTTIKAFGNYSEAVEAEKEEAATGEDTLQSFRPTRSNGVASLNNENDLEFRRPRVYGFVLEKVIGKQGLSGVQFEYAGGRLPFLLGEVKQNPLQFQRYSFFANKTFQDGKNFERINAMFGVSLLRDQRFFGLEAERRSRGWGYFAELDTIPIINHLSLFARYDQLRPTTLLAENTLRGGAFGILFDPIKYGRMSFEYQRLVNGQTANRFRIGWQLNF
ncbi:MAG: cytochrome c [Blastocatellales bacterium]